MKEELKRLIEAKLANEHTAFSHEDFDTQDLIQDEKLADAGHLSDYDKEANLIARIQALRAMGSR